ncbi:hypothetical protein [Ruminococcus sp.]
MAGKTAFTKADCFIVKADFFCGISVSVIGFGNLRFGLAFRS